VKQPGLLHSARRIATLAWPVFVGQVAVLAFATVDTVMVGRYGGQDLAALAIGAAVYVSVFIGLMGVVLAVGPIAGQLYGARRLEECGQQLHQAMWLALGLSLLGCTVLLFPQPFLSLSQATPEVASKVRGYLAALSLALPSALLFTAFRGFNYAVSRPRIVMLLQLGALLLKVPLTVLFVFGARLDLGPIELGLPALGAMGCGVATAVVMACQMLVAWSLVRRDPFYADFGLRGRFSAPHRASLLGLLRLGVPMGMAIAIEVTGFTFMAFFIARFGTTPVASHQIALNLVSLIFMLPMAIGNATGALVAQRIGAGDAADARRLGWHGVEAGLLVATIVTCAVFLLREPILRIYTNDSAIIAAALPLLAWLVPFHIADAGQTLAAFVLRAYRIAAVPLMVYVVAIWGVGMAGGYAVAFNTTGWSPARLQGAQGFWAAATVGLVVAATCLCGYLAWMLKRQSAPAPAAAKAEAHRA
jgi:MATE family multidrug resistance protein